MKNTKRKIELFSFYDKDTISRHLEKMAAKGWMLQHIGTYCWVYKRIEPSNVHFTVSYFPKASEFDPQPSPQKMMFQDFCSHTGWQLAASSAQLQIFYNEKENPIPIETDPMLELEAIQKTARKGFIPTCLLLLILLLIISIFLVDHHPIRYFSDYGQIITSLVMASLLIYLIVELSNYGIWLIKAKKAAEHGEFLKPANTATFQKIIISTSIILLLFYTAIKISSIENPKMKLLFLGSIIDVPLIVIIVNGLKRLLKRHKISKEVNIMVTLFACIFLAFGTQGLLSEAMLQDTPYESVGVSFELHHDKLPLVLEDLTEVDSNAYSYEELRNSGTIFLNRRIESQAPRQDVKNYHNLPALNYEIIDVKMPLLYDLCKDALLNENEKFSNSYHLIDTKSLQANEAYQLFDENNHALDWYLLCYDKQFIKLYIELPLNENQLRIIEEKLIV